MTENDTIKNNKKQHTKKDTDWNIDTSVLDIDFGDWDIDFGDWNIDIDW